MKKTLVLIVCAVFAITMALTGCSTASTSDTTAESSAPAESSAAESSAPAESAAAESSAPAESAAADDTASDTTAASDSDITVVVMPKLIGIPYFNASETGAKKCAEDYGFNLIYTGPTEADATQQVKMIEDFIAQGVDAIAIAPNDPAGITPTLKKATDAGIAVIDWDTAAEKDAVLYSVHQIDDQEYGESVWGAVLEGMGDATDYAILTGGLEAANLNGWIDYGEAYKEENYPDKVLVQDKIPTNESQQEAYSKTLDLMKAYPDVKGIICMSTPTVPGAGQALQELGLQNELTVIGSGMPNDSAPYLKDGSVTASYLWDVENLGYLAAYVAYMCATDQPLEDNLTIDAFDSPIQIKEDGKTVILGAPLIITGENVDDYDY